MASTHLEVYRPFQGELRATRLRFWPVLAASFRVAVKKKLPLVILYAAPVIGMVILSFLVYAKFAAESQIDAEAGGGFDLAGMLAKRAMEILEVKNQIIQFNIEMRLFALLAATWFTSGLLCEDRRAGAHQLYFARPLTRFDYVLGKFLCGAFFAACATLVPGLGICVVASVSSPEWSFLKEEWDVILRTIAYAAVWVTLVVSLNLCVSSLVPRKSFALVGVFALFPVTEAVGRTLSSALDRVDFMAISLFADTGAIAERIFGGGFRRPGRPPEWDGLDPSLAWSVVAGVVLVSWAITAWRVRRLEVVA